MNNNEKGSIFSTFNFLLAAGTIAVFGGLYYALYYKGDIELDEDQEAELEKISESINEELNVSNAIKIMSLINIICDKLVKKYKPDIENRRREAIYNEIEYERVCYEYFECKEDAYQTALQFVLNKSKCTSDDL